MAKIKLTRNELKAQREALARYNRFLPTLELKKMQLETERRKVVQKINEIIENIQRLHEQFTSWKQIATEPTPFKLDELVSVDQIITTSTNIAGIFLPVFQSAKFKIAMYDRLTTPAWLDRGILFWQELLQLHAQQKILQEQDNILSLELRRTTQRINLFKERLIPQCRENIRQIRIYLGDMQAAAVGRAKIAKRKNLKVLDVTALVNPDESQE